MGINVKYKLRVLAKKMDIYDEPIIHSAKTNTPAVTSGLKMPSFSNEGYST